MIFFHKKIDWFLGATLLGILLLFTNGCSTLKDQAAQYQEDVAPIISEFDQIQKDYQKFADKGRKDLNYTTQNFLSDMKELESRTESAKESLEKVKVPEDMKTIHRLGILSMTTFSNFLRDAQISLTKQDQVFYVNETRDEAILLYKQYKTKIKEALKGKN